MGATNGDELMEQEGSSTNSSDNSRRLPQKDDPGLFRLIPLYRLLRRTCTQTLSKIVVTEFSKCKYWKEDPDANTHLDKNLYDFLLRINCKGTNRQKKIKGKPDKAQGKKAW